MPAAAGASLARYRALLGAYLGPQRGRVALLVLLLFSSQGLELVSPQILRSFIDDAVARTGMDVLVGLALLFLAVALAGQVIAVAETYVAQNVGLTATNRLRGDLTLHCLRLDPSFHNSHNPGELIERVDGDVATLSNFFSRFVVYLLGNALLLVGVLALLFRLDWRVGLVAAGMSGAALALVNRLRNLSVPQWAATRQASADLFGFLEERLAGTEDIRANGATAYVLRGLAERSRALLRRQRNAGLIGVTTGSATSILFTLGTAITLIIGAALFTSGSLTIGGVYLIFSYTELLRRPIDQITRQMQDLQQAAAGIGRIGALLDLRSSVRDGRGVPIPAGSLDVAFDGVTFGYAPADPVLRDLTVQVPAGTVLGVLGRTGSGKTTLTRLLFRLYDPQAGTIRLAGVDLRDAHLAELRRRVGMVTQEIQLFHASVRDNLTFFDRGIPDARIVAALEELGLGAWYRGLPAGLDTKLAPGGSGLSAGEAQLVAFARVFLRDPGLVILDEASSRLDPATERQVERAVDRLLAGRTAIIIAHRLATVARADSILILEDGRACEYGARRALAADGDSRFAGLLQTAREEVRV